MLVGVTAAEEAEARACQDSHQLHCFPARFWEVWSWMVFRNEWRWLSPPDYSSAPAQPGYRCERSWSAPGGNSKETGRPV